MEEVTGQMGIDLAHWLRMEQEEEEVEVRRVPG